MYVICFKGVKSKFKVTYIDKTECEIIFDPTESCIKFYSSDPTDSHIIFYSKSEIKSISHYPITYHMSTNPQQSTKEIVSQHEENIPEAFEYNLNLSYHKDLSDIAEYTKEIQIKEFGLYKISNLRSRIRNNQSYMYFFTFIGPESNFEITYIDDTQQIFQNDISNSSKYLRLNSTSEIKSIFHYPIINKNTW